MKVRHLFLAVLLLPLSSRGGLVSRYTFDDPVAAGNDTGPLDNDGSLQGNAAFTADAKVGAGALKLDGNGDYVDVGGSTDLSALDDDGNGFSLTVWAKMDADASTGAMRIFSTWMPGAFTGNGWGVGYHTSNRLLATTYGRFDYTTNNNTAPPRGEWHHLAYVYRPAAGQALFYIDGVLLTTITTATTGMNNTANGFCIGGLGASSSLIQWFKGLLDDIRIYDHELSAVEVQSVWNEAQTGVTAFAAAPASIASGGNCTLTWAVQGNPALKLYGGAFNGQDVTGTTSIPVNGLTASTVFTLTAQTANTVTSRTTIVTVDGQPVPPLISEFMAENGLTLSDSDRSEEDWIEIFNPNSTPLDLANWSLTDDPARPRKWEFPARVLAPESYLVVFASEKDDERRPYGPASELHTNFKLSSGGEYLALLNPAGTVVQSFAPAYPPQLGDISYGRFGASDGYMTPTPGQANVPPLPSVGPSVSELTENPPPPGDADDLPVTCRVTSTGSPVQGVTLNYRVNFAAQVSLPMSDDGQHSDGAAGDGVWGAVIPAAASAPGDMVRWHVVAQSVSGGTRREPSYLFTDRSPAWRGTVVKVTTTTPLPVFQFFTENAAASETLGGTKASVFFNGRFYDNVFIRTRGSAAGSWPKHKFKFDFNPHEHFRWSPNAPEVEEFNLASHYREMFTMSSNTSYMRENLMAEFLTQAGVPAPATQHWHVRRNGSFYGLFSFIEQIDADFLKKHGFDATGPLYKANWKGGNPATCAPAPAAPSYTKMLRETEPWTDFTDFCTKINVANATRFTWIWDNVDVAEVVNVLAAMNTPFNHDQLTKNYYIYFDPPTGEWHRLPWDLDQSFPIGQYITGANWVHPFYGDANHTQELNGGVANPVWQNHLHGAIYANPVTRDMYLRRMKTLADRYIGPSATWVADKVNAWQTLLTPDADADRAYWGTRGVTVSTISAGVSEILNTWQPARRTQLFTTYAQGGTTPLLPGSQVTHPVLEFGTIESNPAGGDQDAEYIEIKNPGVSAVDCSGWTLEGGVSFTFQGGTVIAAGGSLYLTPNQRAFRARTTSPKAGENRFVQGPYSGHLNNLGETLTLKDDTGTVIATVTTPAAPSDPQRFLAVSALHYNPAGSAENSEFLEVMNTSANVTLNLTGVRFTRGIDFAFPAATSLAPGARLLAVKDPAAFQAAYPSVPAARIAGVFANDSSLSNSGERLTLDDATGSTIVDFSFSDEAPWPSLADGSGYCLVLMNPAPGSAYHADPDNWRISRISGGTPGQSDALPPPANPQADDDANGYSNLIEYALGVSPPPEIARGADGSLTVTFSMRPGADAARVSFESSANLMDWSAPASVQTQSEAILPGGFVQRTVRFDAAGSSARNYLRLKVTLR
jgi:hypothetical protein